MPPPSRPDESELVELLMNGFRSRGLVLEESTVAWVSKAWCFTKREDPSEAVEEVEPVVVEAPDLSGAGAR